MVGSCSSCCFEIQRIRSEHLAFNWEVLICTRGLKIAIMLFLIWASEENKMKAPKSGLYCLSKYLKKCVKPFVYFSDVLYFFQLGLIRMISEKNTVDTFAVGV